MTDIDNYYKYLPAETAKALDALISEFGETLPVNFIHRIVGISKSYTSYSVINGIPWNNNPYVIWIFETISSHAFEGRSIVDIKQELTWLRDNIETIVREDAEKTNPPPTPVITHVRIKEFKDGRDGGETEVLATFPKMEGGGITIKKDCSVEVKINGEWHKIWEIRISSMYQKVRDY